MLNTLDLGTLMLSCFTLLHSPRELSSRTRSSCDMKKKEQHFNFDLPLCRDMFFFHSPRNGTNLSYFSQVNKMKISLIHSCTQMRKPNRTAHFSFFCRVCSCRCRIFEKEPRMSQQSVEAPVSTETRLTACEHLISIFLFGCGNTFGFLGMWLFQVQLGFKTIQGIKQILSLHVDMDMLSLQRMA